MDFIDLVAFVRGETRDYTASQMREFIAEINSIEMTVDEVMTYGIISNALGNVDSDARERYFSALDDLRASLRP